MDYFDLHCDTALAILDRNERLEDASGTISLEKAAALHRYAQVYALFIDDKLRGEAAWRQYRRERDYLLRQVKRCSHQIAVCTDAPMLCATLNSGKRAILLSIEGGAAFGGKLERVAEAANDGVRLLTLTWFGENELGYGSGVGGHFKPFGYEVLKECRRCGIVPDISHLSDEGVYDVFSADSGCFIASHSNARNITGHFRNLSDEMMTEIVRRDGLIGLNFSNSFLNNEKELACIDDIYRHIMYFLEHDCENNLCFGSDFDGAHLPHGVEKIGDVATIYTYLEKHGICHDILEHIFFENAERFFMTTLGGKTE